MSLSVKRDVLLKENLDTKKRNEAWYQSAKARKADVTVSESKDAQTQAVAVRCSADRSFFNNCRFIGRQDTLYIKDKARCYFLLSYIEGTVDFIFGDANAVFNHCNIRKPRISKWGIYNRRFAFGTADQGISVLLLPLKR